MISKGSTEWAGTRQWLMERRAEKLEQLASAECGIKEADHLRGRIMFIDEMIRTVEPEFVVVSPPAAQPRAGY